jgi:hypothetical protein
LGIEKLSLSQQLERVEEEMKVLGAKRMNLLQRLKGVEKEIEKLSKNG